MPVLCGIEQYYGFLYYDVNNGHMVRQIYYHLTM